MGLIALLFAPRAAASTPVYVFPIPGSRVAPPHAQIVFRGISASQIGKITVTGSRSGKHTGTVRPDSDGGGGSFLPAKAFTPGETVTVRTKLNLEGTNVQQWSFKVATPGPIPSSLHWPPAPRRSGDVWRFHSRPDLVPPAVRMSVTGTTAPGDIFLGPESGPVQVGPEIVDPRGKLIWFKPFAGSEYSADVRVQQYHGRPVLTWWQGELLGGRTVRASGEDVINDRSYRTIAVVKAADGLSADNQEFLISPKNTALITMLYPVHWNLSSIGGPQDGIVFDGVVQEIDIKTGLLLFQWDSLDHIGLTDSYQTLTETPWFDYFHVNSIQPLHDGTLLISARNTSAAYKIDHRTGRVIWTLGGKRSNFKMGPGAQFAFQHDVEFHGANESLLTVFDDGAGPFKVESQSRALTLSVNTANMTVDEVGQIDHQPPLLTTAMGNYQLLSNGDSFVGWANPSFSEYAPSGRVVLDGAFVAGGWSYRAYRFQWRANPNTHPAVAASTSSGKTTVWASWNGATNVASWRVLGGSKSSSLHTKATAARQGFETAITIGAQHYIAVQALDSRGRTLARASTVIPR